MPLPLDPRVLGGLVGVLEGIANGIEWAGAGACAATRPLGVEALCFPFMQRAVVAGLCLGVVAPLVGSFLVHRDLALIGETLAHTAFAGVAIGLVISAAFAVAINPYITALVVAVTAALGIHVLVEHTDVYGDVSMAIILAGGFAVGSVLISVTEGGIAVGINQYLFGSLVTATRSNVAVLVVLSVVVAGIITATYRQLTYVTFDATAARAGGIPVTRYNRLLVVVTALVVVAAMGIMGIILVAALLVVPVAAATQLAWSFKSAVLLSIVAAELAVLGGIAVSYGFGLATGGSIVLVAIAIYGLAAVTGQLASPDARESA